MFPFFWAVFYTIVTFLLLMGFGGILELVIDIGLDTRAINQNTAKTSNHDQRDEALIKWLRANPTKGVNDYYADKV
jgi:hypothetical protein